MFELVERRSANSPLNIFDSFCRNIMSNSFTRMQHVLPLEENKEDSFDSTDIQNIFTDDTVIWIKGDSSENYHIDISTKLSDLVIHFLSKISEIKQIYLLKETENVFHVWSIISAKKESVKKKIYKQERIIISYFKDTIYFDFHIDALSDIKHIKNTGALIIFKKK